MSTARTHDFSKYSFKQTVQFYQALRKLTYNEMNTVYQGFNSSPISLPHSMEADRWRGISYTESREEWSWVKAFHIYNAKSMFKRFDIAVSQGSNIVGLAYGIPNQTKSNLRVNLIESTPYKNHRKDVRVFELISEAAQIYADLLGADEIRIMKPVNSKVANYYASYGYDVIQPTNKKMPVFCSMKLRG